MTPDIFDAKTPTGRMLRNMWSDIQKANDEAAVKDAKANPEKYKLSRLIADGKPASYTFYRAQAKGRVLWCWSTHPNIAGYYLSWRQAETKRTIKRTQFKAHKHSYLGQQRAKRELEKTTALTTQ
jgi:hypothetical protein